MADMTPPAGADEFLGRAGWSGAEVQPLAGQLAVANVVINRAKSGRFASDICGVVKQRGQFSFVRGGRLVGDWPGLAPAALHEGRDEREHHRSLRQSKPEGRRPKKREA